MKRSLYVAALITALAACGPRAGAGAQSGGGTRSALDEAARLDAMVEKLYVAAKYQEAQTAAERSLALREATLGPTDAAVAVSLHNLARIHRARAAFVAAEPLAIRALELREKAGGLEPSKVAESLNELGLLYVEQAAYGKAEPLLTRALAIRESALGPMHADVAQSLYGLAELYRAQSAYDKAEPLAARALAIREGALGPMHPDVAASLVLLAEIHRARGALDKAEPLLQRALELREKVLGPMHPDVARSLAGLASLTRDRGLYDKAEPLVQRAIGIFEKALGPTHPDLARALDGLGTVYHLRGDVDKARPLHARALEIAEKALGPAHPDVAQYLGNLGNDDWVEGKYDQAKNAQRRALEIREKVFGPMHPEVAKNLNNLAMVLHVQAAHDQAEPLYLRAIDIMEKTLGPANPRVARILVNLAALYWEEGAYASDERVLLRAIDITENALGPMHPDLGIMLHSLALLYHIQGAYAKAQPLYDRALDISQKTLGPAHPEVIRLLGNLAGHYTDQGLYGKAEPILVRALELSEKTLGPKHTRTASALKTLASIYRYQGQFEKARPLVHRALGIFEDALGPMHPHVAVALQELAEFYWAQGRYDKAEAALARAADIREGQLRVELPRLSEPRKRALMTLLEHETDSAVSLHALAMPHNPRALELALTTVLRRKGRIIDSLVESESALRAHLTPGLRDQLDQLDRARSDLVTQLYAPQEATDRAAIATVHARIDELEAALSTASAAFRAQAEPVTIANVQAAIPAGAALVELVRYHRFDPQQRPPWREEHYAAYLMTQQGPLQWVALGRAATIDAQVDATLAAMSDQVSAARADGALRHLDALVLAPIRRALPEVSHLILAPDGKLNLVPFDALIDAHGRHALQSTLISYVTTGRDLLRLAAPAQPRSAAVIVAGPDYGSSPRAGAIRFAPLTEALGEAADLEKYFPDPPLTGERATKSALKQLVGPAMLHVATHGFYARDRGAKPARAVANRARAAFSDPSSPLLPPPRPDDPADGLDRAGLAMAGANEGPGGILTAREIAGFDWWGTQLVVLSACDTGVGAVPSGDGVYGMRRALVLAGAASQVVSLWAVDDASTRELMRAYYAELAQGAGRAEALRAAKLRLMRQPRHAHPQHWAAFIAAGDWRPLDERTISPARGSR
ncbi:MAG TPA: CHAT domain-containing tetratricopeptide repeat protein [Kofleriaceae bacterium]|nr:CHAT domain-containing tetratricopeptide repeat protein [Kofleriaceae bacterium]